MVAALELYFDPVARKRVRTLWDALEDVSVPTLRDLTHRKHRPHMSLLSAGELDADAVLAALGDLDAAPPMRLRLDHIGLFRGKVLWLGPVVTPELLAHHEAVVRRLEAAGIGYWPEYAPGAWVPHCTVSMRVPLARLTTAIHRCMDVLPIEATIAGGAVADHVRDRYTPLPARRWPR